MRFVVQKHSIKLMIFSTNFKYNKAGCQCPAFVLFFNTHDFSKLFFIADRRFVSVI
jgi:hypothetical protein